MTSKAGGVKRSVSDIQEVLYALEEGSSLTRYSRNRRPEVRLFRVVLNTRELMWMRNQGGKADGVGMFPMSTRTFEQF